MTEKREFLVCYDYGGGGLWGIMNAATEKEILAVYPELDIASEPPAWMTPDEVEEFRNQEWHDIDGAPWGILNVIISDRTKK